MALTESKPRAWAADGLASYKVAANEQIYGGGAVGVQADGYAKAYAAEANVVFGGFAVEDAKGGATDGLADVQVRTSGYIELDVVGADISHLGDVVRAKDDDTFQLAALANSAPIGLIAQHIAGSKCLVKFEAFAEEFAKID